MRQSINAKRIAIVAVLLVILFWLIGWYWSLSPDTYDIKDPSEKVKIALLALDNSDHGLTVKQILAKEDCENWDLFRSKLQSLLGRDNDSYREEFEDWHNSDDPPTLAIAKLITIYKFSFDPPKESLTAEDEQRIIRKTPETTNVAA